jgi:2-dehydro-3-deoxy-D-arabinonate dehydratase
MAPDLLIRYCRPGRETARWGLLDGERDTVHPLPLGLDELARMPLDAARAALRPAPDGYPLDRDEVELLAPVGTQDVWAAGVTYRRSRDARIEESGAEDLYDRVYRGARPELFFKAPAAAVRGPGAPVGIRRDATWSVPEPELAVVFNARMEVLGFSIGNDMSSRDIEGENALYLPQAKVYDGSCALGPGILPVWAAEDDPRFAIALTIERDGEPVFSGATSTDELVRGWAELGSWLAGSLSFPGGVVLLTGTGIVPDADVALQEGDVVEIAVGGIGVLRNPVRRVGARVPALDAK